MYATSIWYLNDVAEIAHAAELAQQLIEQRATTAESRVDADTIRTLQRAFIDVRFPCTYVVSFSEHGDQLSQWRGYCHDRSGFSLGFATKDIQNLAEHQGFSLLKCVYYRDEQEQIVSALLDDAIRRLLTTPVEGDREVLELSVRLRFLRSFSTLSPTLKHPSFSEEAEWRLILATEDDTGDEKYRSGSHTLIPYRSFQLADSETSACINELVVGPSPLQPLGVIAAEDFAKRCELPIGSTRPSTVPYRQV
jgi:hypothetical protein